MKIGRVFKVVFKDKVLYKDFVKVFYYIRGIVERFLDFLEFIKEVFENVGDENGCI